MKLIIDIPEENYKKDNLIHFFGVYSVKLDEVIKNGIPLDVIKTDIETLEDEIMAITRCKDSTYYDTLNGIELALNVIDKHIGVKQMNDELDFVQPKKVIGKMINIKVLEDIKAEIISQLDMYEYCVEDDIELGEIRAYNDVLDIIDKHIGDTE